MDGKMTYQIIQGDALEIAKTQPDNSVHCITTSPPYFRLRKYSTAVWIDEDEQCKHVLTGQVCGKCGARYIDQQIGIEDSVSDYIARLVELFRELRRILHPSGVVFLNLGDSRAGSGGSGGDYNKGGKRAGQPRFAGTRSRDTHFKAKDLMMVPARVAIALQNDGWYLRSDIIWSKPSVMPESVTDRPTRSYEHVFLLTKSPRYFWDSWAIREKSVTGFTRARKRPNGLSVVEEKEGEYGFTSCGITDTRNSRDVWVINPSSNTGIKHYATMPVELAKKCILAGSSEYGVCSKCLAPYRRIIKRTPGYSKECPKTQAAHEARGGGKKFTGTVGKSGGGRTDGTVEFLGWEPTCKCQDATVIPSVVYDPFAGAGTTMLAAELLGRNSLGSELGAGYIEMAHERIARDLIKYSKLPRAREAVAEPEVLGIFSLEGIEDES